MKAKKVAAGIVVFVLVIVSVLYGVVEYNYHGHLYEWCIPAMRRNAAQYFIDNWQKDLDYENSYGSSRVDLGDLQIEDLEISGPIQKIYSENGEIYCSSVFWMISKNGRYIGYVMQNLGPHAIYALLQTPDSYHIQFKNVVIFNNATRNGHSPSCVSVEIINRTQEVSKFENIRLCIGDQLMYSWAYGEDMKEYQSNLFFKIKTLLG